jgi:hypothetical protein
MKTLLNCTPHAVTIGGVSITPSGILPRVEIVRTKISDIITEAGNFPAYTVASGKLTGLPEPDGDSIFIVSAMVRMHPDVSHRDDLASPGILVRDEAGNIIGADGLDFNA